MTAPLRPRVIEGLPPHLVNAAAALYWQAFGGKLGRVLGPEARARTYLADVIDTAHVLAALSPDGALLGIAGFKTAKGAFADGGFAELSRHYGAAGAAWRASALWLLSREVDNRRFLIDGICVERGARGQGVGTALLAALADAARQRGFAELRLEVVNTNIRARALYERAGFHAIGTETLGPLRHLFGFESAVTMVCQVG